MNRLKGMMLARTDELQRIPMSTNVEDWEPGWYLVYRLKRDFASGECDCKWIELVSEGRLQKPSQLFIDYLELHFDIFIKYFNSGIPYILNILKAKANCCDKILAFQGAVQSLSDDKFCQRIKDMYFKCLIRSKVRDLNEGIAQEKADKYAARKIKQHIN